VNRCTQIAEVRTAGREWIFNDFGKPAHGRVRIKAVRCCAGVTSFGHPGDCGFKARILVAATGALAGERDGELTHDQKEGAAMNCAPFQWRYNVYLPIEMVESLYILSFTSTITSPLW
jgi:hypothetical protein